MLTISFEEALAQVIQALQNEGFGILTEIDAQLAFKHKLGLECRPYKILGACHPKLAYEMLQIDNKAGALFPCNVVVQAHADGNIEVSAVDPVVMFALVDHPQAAVLARQARQSLQTAMAQLGTPHSVLLAS
ncbi:MAG: DUF302 domain-containing protein [Cyanobacteria bacterium P01_D01_bin.44]